MSAPAKIPPLICKNELEFHRWFRSHLDQFGYSRALVDYQGKYRKGFPDFWCVVEGPTYSLARVERVELELLSYNFVLHRHDPRNCDLILCVEDNRELYGVDPTKEWFGCRLAVADGVAAAPPQMERSRYNITLMLARGRVAPALAWWQPPQLPGNRTCRFCQGSVEHALDSAGRIIWSREDQFHQECVLKAKGRLQNYTG